MGDANPCYLLFVGFLSCLCVGDSAYIFGLRNGDIQLKALVINHEDS